MQPMSQPIEGAEARDRRRRGRKRSGRRSRLTQDPQIIHRSKAREGSQQTNVAGCGLVVVVVVVRRRRERRSEYRSRSAFSWNSTMRPMGQWVLLQGEGRSLVVPNWGGPIECLSVRPAVVITGSATLWVLGPRRKLESPL